MPSSSCHELLHRLDFLSAVLDDASELLETIPLHELHTLEVDRAAHMVRAKWTVVKRRLPEPLSAQARSELRRLRELAGGREPAPGQREYWLDEALRRDLPKDNDSHD